MPIRLPLPTSDTWFRTLLVDQSVSRSIRRFPVSTSPGDTEHALTLAILNMFGYAVDKK
jgi:hypothetical protein